jgi:hypothetical protein
MLSRFLSALMLCAALAGCGGSGGTETLEVALDFPGAQMQVPPNQPMQVKANITGLKGHTPHCAVVGGALPSGVVLSDNCTLSGTPTAVGTYSFSLRLTANDVSGYLDFGVTLYVVDLTPSLIAERSSTLQFPAIDVDQEFALNSVLTGIPVLRLGNYGSLGGDTLLYTLASGALPSGLTMDPATGLLHGSPTAPGKFLSQITVSLTRNGVVYTSAPAALGIYIVEPRAQLVYPPCTALWATSVSCLPTVSGLPSGAHVNFGPWAGLGGLAIDTGTGQITGPLTIPGNVSGIVDGTVVLADGNWYVISNTVQYTARMPTPSWDGSPAHNNLINVLTDAANAPVYGQNTVTLNVTAGQSFQIDLVSTQDALAGDTATFTLEARPGETLPGWLSMVNWSGRLLGTVPKTPGIAYTFEVVHTTTRNGLTAATRSIWQINVK